MAPWTMAGNQAEAGEGRPPTTVPLVRMSDWSTLEIGQSVNTYDAQRQDACI